MTARRARVLRELADARLMAMTPEELAALDNRILAAVTAARWPAARRLTALRLRVTNLEPAKNRQMIDTLNGLAAGIDRREKDAAIAEAMRQHQLTLPAQKLATEK